MAARKPTKKSARKKATPSKSAPMAAKRDDFGASTDRYFAEQPPEKRALLEELRALVKKGVPDAHSSIKWGIPVYQRNGKNICAIAAFKEHVGINFFAPPSVLADPKKKLEGGGKSMRMLKVRSPGDIDRASITRWLKATVAHAD